jgi:hypothetical protein
LVQRGVVLGGQGVGELGLHCTGDRALGVLVDVGSAEQVGGDRAGAAWPSWAQQGCWGGPIFAFLDAWGLDVLLEVIPDRPQYVVGGSRHVRVELPRGTPRR